MFPSAVLVGAKNALVDGYTGFQNLLSHYVNHPASLVATLEEPIILQPQPVNNQEVIDNSHGREGTLESGAYNDNNSTTSGANLPEEADMPSFANREYGSEEVFVIRSTRRWLLMAMLVVGVLALVVVPGLILGFLTRQMPWGIALSGAIATVIGVVAGLYCRNRSSDG